VRKNYVYADFSIISMKFFGNISTKKYAFICHFYLFYSKTILVSLPTGYILI